MAAFMKIPGFSPFSGFNLSGICATTRLMQIRMMGLGMCNVKAKFEKDPNDVPDLANEDFLCRRKMLARMKRELKKNRPELGEFEPILYVYELYSGETTDQMHMGHMVWTDMTLTRFFLVNLYGSESCNCGNPFHNDYHELMKLQAQKFLNLLTYLQCDNGPAPQWVRATFTTDNQGAWDPRFVTEAGSPSPNAHQPIVHLTPADLVPSLTANNLKSIDNVLARNHDKARPEHRAMVLTKNVVNLAQNVPIIPLETGCAGCQKTTDRKRLMKCSRCRLAAYCSKECQKAHWPKHKVFCVKA